MRPLVDADTWRDVFGYEGIYLVSQSGLVYSQPRTEFVQSSRTGGHLRHRGGKLRKITVNPLGYAQVSLHLGTKKKLLLVHRIVAQAFIPNPGGLKEVNHKDGDKGNNLAENLEWVTRTQNSLHSTQVLCKNRGEDNAKSLLSEKDVLEIKDLLEAGESQTEVASRYKVSNHAIYRIHRGFNWAWLTGYSRKEVVCHIK